MRPTSGGTMREFNFNNPMSALAATMVMNKAREAALAKRLGTKTNSPQQSDTRIAPQSQPQSKPVDETSLRFRSTAGYIKPRELADQLGSDQIQRDQYFALMNAVLDAFGKKVAAAGLQNDVAIALSYFFGENIRIYRGMPELSDQQFVNLRNSFASALVSGGGFGNATDRQKQEMYETLVIYTGLTQFFYDQAIQAKEVQMAKSSQQLAGQNLQTVTLTSPDSLSLSGDSLTVEPTDNPGLIPQAAMNSGAQTGGAAIEIRQIALDYRENWIRADRLYKGKRIIATGTVGSIEDFGGKTVLFFERGLLNPETICYFRDVNQLGSLRRLNGVTVDATVLGFDGDKVNVLLDDCILR
jgi:hypothetical protein